MNKKLFLVLFATIGLLFATSCTHEDLDAVQDSEFAEVSLSIGLEGGLGTKAISDGSGADKLVYAVYNSQNQLITTIEGSTNGEFVKDPAFNALKETVSFTLAKGQTYTAVFWAQNKACNAYTVTTETDGIKVAVDYAGFNNNDETRDAFFAYKTFTVTGREEIDVTLRRPFAQINVGVTQDDWNSAVNSGITVSESKVVIKNAATSINLLDGRVSGETAVEYDFAAIPAKSNEILKVDLDKDGNFADHEKFVYLSMSYILTGEQKSTLLSDGLNFTFSPVSGEDITFNEGLHNVPVQRNWRTNIIGQILTGDITFNITIDPIPFDNNNIIHPDGYKIEGTTAFVSTPQGLAAVAEGIANGEIPSNTNLNLTSDLDLSNFSPLVKSDAKSNWTPIGTSSIPFTGVFDGNGYTIKNLVIDGGSNSNIGLFGYTKDGEIKNLTIENAKVSGRLNVGVVAGTPYTSKYTNITVKGHVEVNGMAYVGAVGGKNAYADWTDITVDVDETSYVNANSVENGTAYRTYVGGVCGFNGEGGHSFKNIKSNINVKGSTIDVGGLFGIAHYGNKFENCVCTGNVEIYAASELAEAQEIGGIAGVWHPGGQNVVMNNCSFTGTLKANNDFVINTSNFGNFVCAAYTTTGNGKLIIDGVPYSAAENLITTVSNADELVAALKDGKSVRFNNDITIAATKGGYNKAGILQNNAQTIDGNGYTLTVTGAGATWDCAIYTNGGIIKNLTVKGAMRGIFTAGQSSDLYINNVEFKNVIYTFSSDGKMPAKPFGVYVSNSTVNGWTSHSNMHTEVVYTNCSFGEGSGYKYCRPYGKSVFNNCTFCAEFTFDNSKTTDITFNNCTWN